MKLKPKYLIGDKVWYLDYNGKVVNQEIQGVRIISNDFDGWGKHIEYYFNNHSHSGINENKVHPTEEDLLNSLRTKKVK